MVLTETNHSHCYIMLFILPCRSICILCLRLFDTPSFVFLWYIFDSFPCHLALNLSSWSCLLVYSALEAIYIVIYRLFIINFCFTLCLSWWFSSWVIVCSYAIGQYPSLLRMPTFFSFIPILNSLAMPARVCSLDE